MNFTPPTLSWIFGHFFDNSCWYGANPAPIFLRAMAHYMPMQTGTKVWTKNFGALPLKFSGPKYSFYHFFVDFTIKTGMSAWKSYRQNKKYVCLRWRPYIHTCRSYVCTVAIHYRMKAWHVCLTSSWWVTTLWVNRQLGVSQLDQLNLSSFRGLWIE